ncbi:MAG: glutamate-1-semialdehyde 2,1-aminomutase, partial [Candidatus Sumerlaeota bacterium]
MTRSEDLFQQAQQHIPGGVNSPVRAFKSVGGVPPFIAKAKGARMWDVDGNEYIDHMCSWGPMILGHSPDFIVDILKQEIANGTSYGAPCEYEVKIAELITGAIPSVEMVRMVNSGTEATMSAIRLARAYTQRDKIIKFTGCYHGHSDCFLIAAGSGGLTLGVPNSPGVTKGAAADTMLADFNDTALVERCFESAPDEIAAIIVEPIPGNMGLISPKDGFLESLRELATQHGALLIFDEVISGFRAGPGGAQERYGVRPDLTTLGKIIGGGFPVGAFGGSGKIMSELSPMGPVYQAGTLSGNPVAMRAGYETLKKLTDSSEVYDKLESLGARIEKGIRKNLEELELDLHFVRVGSSSCLFFCEGPVENLDDAKRTDTESYGLYFHEMLKRGVYLPPAQF